MSGVCNGVNTDIHSTKSDSLESDELRNIQEDFKEENLTFEVFRGFAKIPRVLLPRYDITPYLDKYKKSLYCKGRRFKITPLINNIIRGCNVKLVQQDLEKLKQALGNFSPRSDISATDLDETMGHLKCKICDKIYSSEKKLQNHQQNKHMIIYKPHSKPQKRVSFSDTVIIHEVKEYHKCRKCPKIFEEYKSLKIHMKERHKKRKCYICNYCNKNFMDRMFFKVHIRLHCDVCSMLFPNKSKYLEHRRVVCRVLKLHKCRTCEESFFRFMDLKDHSYEHLSTFFICDICKDQFATKCGVSHHIKYLHSEKRPTSLYAMRNLGTERLYLCNFCEESSVERDIIEAHVQTLPDLTNRAMTGYKDYYFCDQCLKKFDTEQDMLQHKWTHFLKRSDNSQIREKALKRKKLVKTTYNLNEKIPEYMQPKLVLDKIKVGGKVLTDTIGFVDVNSFDVFHGEIKKPVVDPKSKKTIISRHQCQTCSKYYSSGYSLNRHMITQHGDYENLRCNICEETFVWPSLLQSHKCIRLNIPEMPFDDARPEIHFDNLQDAQNGFDDFNITDNDDYMNSVDFEIPAPIVTLNECSTPYYPNDDIEQLQSFGYKVVMQEVPIEF
ncbi:uncharacterized protein ACR2FA_009966 [Aphomia sociella]